MEWARSCAPWLGCTSEVCARCRQMLDVLVAGDCGAASTLLIGGWRTRLSVRSDDAERTVLGRFVGCCGGSAEADKPSTCPMVRSQEASDLATTGICLCNRFATILVHTGADTKREAECTGCRLRTSCGVVIGNAKFYPAKFLYMHAVRAAEPRISSVASPYS